MTVTKSVVLNMRMPPDLVREAKRKAKQQDRPLSQVVRELLRMWLSDQAQPTQAIK